MATQQPDRPDQTTTRIELVEVGASDAALLDNLLQLYQYDFSEFSRGDPQHGHVREDGRFYNVDINRFFDGEPRHAFLVHVDGRLGGLALVSRQPSLKDAGETVWWMEEFFVMRKFRRLGVGDRVATTIFDRFPGTWEVAQMAVNTGAQAFWRSVIGRYTNGRFEETFFNDDRWLGPVQQFDATGG